MRVTIASFAPSCNAIGGWDGIFIRSTVAPARRDDGRRDVLSARERRAFRFNSSERVLIFDNDFQGYALAIALCAGASEPWQLRIFH